MFAAVLGMLIRVTMPTESPWRKHMDGKKVLCFVLASLFLVGGCAPLHDVVLPTYQPPPTYDELYPLYIELCAVSQIRAKFAKEGGSPGHAVMWLKGVCRDEEATYPKLKLCDPSEVDLGNPENGTGVSVNKVLKNANWLAIPGRSLFFYGNLTPDTVLDKEHGIATIEDAHRVGVFDLVDAHEQYVPPEDDRDAVLKFLATETLGTDFGLTFGRSVLCSRLPVTEPMMEDIVGYLNGLNEEYSDGEHEYNWSGYSDNCVHAVINALAAADIWAPKSVRQVKLLQLFNLAVPSNEFARLLFRTTTFPVESFGQVYGDRDMRDSLTNYNWLPTRHGALLTVDPVHQKNELYDTRFRIMLLQGPIFKSKGKKIKRISDNPDFTDMKANLEHFKSLYEEVIAGRPDDWDYTPKGDPVRASRKQYYEYIETQLEDVNRKLLLIR
jgi:hypothetical protein